MESKAFNIQTVSQQHFLVESEEEMHNKHELSCPTSYNLHHLWLPLQSLKEILWLPADQVRGQWRGFPTLTLKHIEFPLTRY